MRVGRNGCVCRNRLVEREARIKESAISVYADEPRNQSVWLDPGVYGVKKAQLHGLLLECHALGHIASNRLPTAKKFLFGLKLSPSLDVFDPSHRS